MVPDRGHVSSFFVAVEVEAHGLVGEAAACFDIGVEFSEEAGTTVLDGRIHNELSGKLRGDGGAYASRPCVPRGVGWKTLACSVRARIWRCWPDSRAVVAVAPLGDS